MVDLRFYTNRSPYSIEYIAHHAACEFDAKNADMQLNHISPIESAVAGDLTFLSNKKYVSLLNGSQATACIVNISDDVSSDDIILLRSTNAYYSYSKALSLFYKSRISEKDISPIHHTAKIGDNCRIGHNVVIEANAEIGCNSVINHGAVIGQGVKIGDNAYIGAGVVIEYTIIGSNVVILAGAKIGQDGFGFATYNMKHHKIFHVGRVIIGDDVEIGANTTIDRGSINDTVIGNDVRIDNLVQIAHNVFIDEGSVIVAQVGIAGSSKIGKYCALGGQVGISGHLKIADRVQIAGQGGVIQDVKDAGVVLGGTPAVPIREWHKQSIMLKKMVNKG